MRLGRVVSMTAVCAALAFSATGCGDKAVSADKKDSQQNAIENVSYVDGDSTPGHQIDIYLPARDEKEKCPVILWIHGGAWIGGDKQPAPITALLSNGYAVVGVNYRLAPAHTFPAQIYDCKSVVRWVRKNADKYGFDPHKIGVFGVSAGGHLAALLGVSNGNKDLEGDVGVVDFPSDVQAVCDWCGPTNLFTMKKQAGKNDQLDYDSPKAPVKQFLGGDIESKGELAKLASPVLQLKDKAVPFLIMHGDADNVVPPGQSKEFAEALKAKNADVDYKIVKGGEHMFLTPETMKDVVDFFDSKLKGPIEKIKDAVLGADEPKAETETDKAKKEEAGIK